MLNPNVAKQLLNNGLTIGQKYRNNCNLNNTTKQLSKTTTMLRQLNYQTLKTAYLHDTPDIITQLHAYVDGIDDIKLHQPMVGFYIILSNYYQPIL